MATAPGAVPQQPAPPTIHRPSSPSPDTMPTLAVKSDATAENLRSLSTASSVSHGSATTDASSLLSLGFTGRDSLGSDASSTAFSRQSSGSYTALSPPLSVSSSSNPNRLSGVSTITTSSSMTGSGISADQRTAKRRGYMRPQGTDFAASARSRESVLSLGSIAHLQHYFARTGLLDLKGQLERKRRGGKARTLDLSQLEGTTSYLAPRAQSMLIQPSDGSANGLGIQTDVDSSYASMGSSPDLAAHNVTPGMMVESPTQEHVDYGNDDWYPEDFEGYDPAVMLPPTVSTYMYREKPLPKPPTLAELRADLKNSLDSASKALAEAREAKTNQGAPATPINSAPSSPARQPNADGTPAKVAAPSWYEIQGMHILDVITLAIRAAKVYYTGHENPDRLDSIKSEREVRSELLAVMDVLKRMATRNFSGGVRSEEIRAMDAWINSLYAMLNGEDAIIAAEQAEQASWSWLKDEGWPADVATDPARAYAREHAFLKTILANGPAPGEKIDMILPDWIPMDRSTSSDTLAVPADDTTTQRSTSPSSPTTPTTPTSPTAPTSFLQHMQNGVCLVQLHNCAVRMSRRRFGAIPTFHSDTQKPYRAADNLRYWVKAAELRWEVLFKIDALGVVCNSRPDVWPVFEDAIYQWCRKVREEISSELV
ncbi:hypothetical protein SEUCBS139899_004913 [Sporothrix eucalyptigena]|uniref:Uncharacterized protein n=1 Tax=Sporothrix eucalyptigena TaxID=1812306 RepID=A0ABP0AN85_9PEZI